MTQQTRIMVVATVIIFACSCTAFFGGLGLGYGFSEELGGLVGDGDTSGSGGPAPFEPVERPAQRGQLLLTDDFSQERWDVYEDGDHRKGYEAGHYFIVVEVEEFNYWSLAGQDFGDFVLEVETTQVGGPDDNDYGLMLRHQDDDNFYSFEISGDGFYTFSKLVEGELFDIIPWQESEAIQQGNHRNKLRVEAIGPNFTFYINDTRVDAAIDPEFNEGDIGLLVGTYSQPGVHIAFDNLNVWAAE